MTVLDHQIEYLSEDGSPDMSMASDMRQELENMCVTRHSSLSCMRNFTQELPDDVAMLSQQIINQQENLFSYACGGKSS